MRALLEAIPGSGFRKWAGVPFFLPGIALMFVSGLIAGAHRGGRLVKIRTIASMPFLLPSIAFLLLWHIISPPLGDDFERDDQGD